MVSNVKLFESSQIRSIWAEDEQTWYFSIIDVVAALTDSPNPRDYWYRIKQREKISGMELSTICRQFKLAAPDGKLRQTDCSHTEGLLRIIQSIPSPKAEPFKRWLAQVGYERLEEIENPDWVPCVNNFGSYGRWAFAVFTDMFQMQKDFAAKVKAEFGKMISTAVAGALAAQPA